MKVVTIFELLALFIKFVQSSELSETNSSILMENSDTKIPNDLSDSSVENLDINSGISSIQIEKIRESLASDDVFKTLENACQHINLFNILENADIAVNAGVYNYAFKISAEPVRMKIDPMFSSALSFVRANILGKYKVVNATFKLSEWHLCYHAFLETGINLINQLTINRHSRCEAEKILKYNFNDPRYSLDQLLEVMDKHGVVPSSAFPEPYDDKILKDLQKYLNQFIFHAYLQLKNALESDLPKVKQNLLVSLLRFLSIKIGVPPKEFSFNLELCGKPAIMFKNVTANDFYSLSGGKSRHKIIQFGSDPALEYYKTYTYSNHKCLTEGTGFTFINIPIQEMNEIAVRSITKNGRIAHFSHLVSGHESIDKKVFDRNLFSNQESLFFPVGTNRSDTIEYSSSLEKSSGIIWSVLYDEEKSEPIQWKLETPYEAYFCVRNNYFLENGLLLAVKELVISPEMSRMLEEPAIVISDGFSKLA